MFNLKPFIQSFALTCVLASPYSEALQSSDKNQLPEIGTAGVSTLSVDKERLIGDVMMRQVRATLPVVSDPVLSEYINHLGNTLVKNANGVYYKFEFFLINNQEINAFAFFGGHVGVHTGLITTADNESQLASVLAHEVSHVTQRHLARRIEAQTRSQPMTMAAMVSSVLIALVNPSVGMAALMSTMAVSQQMGINYTRGNEKEADRVGMDLLVNSNFDPKGTPEFFNKMSEQYRYRTKPPAMLLTHPLPEARISDARTRAFSYPPKSLPPSPFFELAKARIQARYQGNEKGNVAYFENILDKKQYVLKNAALYGLALSLFEDNQVESSLELLENLHIEEPRNLFYVDALSDVYIRMKEFDKAINMLSELELLMPNNQVVALNYANVLQEAKEYDKAAEILKDFLLVKPGHFLAYDLLTTVYQKQDNKALMHINKAEVLALVGAYQQAIDELQTSYNFAEKQPLIQKRIKARILQFKAQEERIKRL